MNSRILAVRIFFAAFAIASFFGTFVYGGQRTALVALFFFIPRIESFVFRIIDKNGPLLLKIIRWVFFAFLIISIAICVFCALYLQYDNTSVSLIAPQDSVLLNGVTINYKSFAFSLFIIGSLIVLFDAFASSYDSSSFNEHKEITEKEKSVNERITDYTLKENN